MAAALATAMESTELADDFGYPVVAGSATALTQAEITGDINGANTKPPAAAAGLAAALMLPLAVLAGHTMLIGAPRCC